MDLHYSFTCACFPVFKWLYFKRQCRRKDAGLNPSQVPFWIVCMVSLCMWVFSRYSGFPLLPLSINHVSDGSNAEDKFICCVFLQWWQCITSLQDFMMPIDVPKSQADMSFQKWSEHYRVKVVERGFSPKHNKFDFSFTSTCLPFRQRFLQTNQMSWIV